MYEVERILAKRGSGARAQFLVKWLGYPEWDATWERSSDLTDAQAALADYERVMADHDSF